MSVSDEYKETLEELAENVTQLGDEINEKSEIGEKVATSDGENLYGFRAERNGTTYIFSGRKDRPYTTIAVIHSVLYSLSSMLSEETIEELADEDADEPGLKAAESWLESVDEDLMEEIEFYLWERVTSPQVSARFESTENGAFSGVIIERKIFPYDDNFSLTELERSVQAVKSVGDSAKDLIAATFGLEEELSQPQPTRPSDF